MGLLFRSVDQICFNLMYFIEESLSAKSLFFFQTKMMGKDFWAQSSQIESGQLRKIPPSSPVKYLMPYLRLHVVWTKPIK